MSQENINQKEAMEKMKSEIGEKYELYIHFLIESEKENEKSLMQTSKFSTVLKNFKIIDLKQQIQKSLKEDLKSENMKYTPISISKTPYSPALKDTTKLRLYFDNLDDVFVKLKAEAIPVTTTMETKKDDVLIYTSISNYSFYVASESIVKVLVPVPGIDKLTKNDIVSHFTDDSLDIKINSFQKLGKNYRFCVPKLDSKIIPESSSAFIKGDRLIIKLKKFKNEDHWSYLFKQKYIGE